MESIRRAPIRVIHCPDNIAGQAWAYAKAVEKFGAVASVVTFVRHPFGFPDDRCLDLNPETAKHVRLARRLRHLLEAIKDYDVVHFHFAATILPGFMDLRFLRTLKKPMVMNFWGSDIGLGSVAERRNPYFHLIEGYTREDDLVMARMKEITKYIDVAIVPDYELYDYVADHFEKPCIIPNCVSTEELLPVYPAPSEEGPLVVHCPSNRNIKGSRYVLDAVRSIQADCRFKFELGEGATNHAIRKLLKKADIVIDQLLLGTYGVVATEAMALGKPVVCYVLDDVRERYHDPPPIVNANPDNVKDVLLDLIRHPERLEDLGRKSRASVEGRHSMEAVGLKLMRLYEELL